MLNTNLHEYGYVGDVSELLFDIFTGGLVSEQDTRLASVAQRLDDWNKFLRGDISKLPGGCINSHHAAIDPYLAKELAKYIAAWIETDGPAPSGKFTIAKDAIDDYFKSKTFFEEIDFYREQGRLPAIGRSKFILTTALDVLSKCKSKSIPLGVHAQYLDAFARDLAKQQAASSHTPSRGNWGIGI